MTATKDETIQPRFGTVECPNKMVSAADGVDYAFWCSAGGARCPWSCSSTSAAISTTGTRR